MNRDPRLDPNADPVCRDEDPEVFYPTGREDMWDPIVVAYAKSVCNRCTLQPECLAYATASGQAYGIWGGQTPKERALGKRDAAKARTDAEQRRLLGDLLRERAGDPDALLKEFVHPPMVIAGWAE